MLSSRRPMQFASVDAALERSPEQVVRPLQPQDIARCRPKFTLKALR
jgi:hypothetical protein